MCLGVFVFLCVFGVNARDVCGFVSVFWVWAFLWPCVFI